MNKLLKSLDLNLEQQLVRQMEEENFVGDREVEMHKRKKSFYREAGVYYNELLVENEEHNKNNQWTQNQTREINVSKELREAFSKEN